MNKITIITGHYGSGKTTIAIDWAIKLKNQGKKVTVIDLDIVNPFFRTSEYKEYLHFNGVKTIIPTQAGTTTDMPGLSPEINNMFSSSDIYYIVDVGGDDVGATVLGQYASKLEEIGYDMYYVINKYRYMTQSISQVIDIYNEIELSSRLKINGIINNSNLGVETTVDLIENSKDFVIEIAKILKLPIIELGEIEILKNIR